MISADAFRARLALAASIREGLGEALETDAERARWLAMLAEQYARRAGKRVERFTVAPDSPEAAFLP